MRKQLFLYPKGGNEQCCKWSFSIDVGETPYNAKSVLIFPRIIGHQYINSLILWLFEKFDYCVYYGLPINSPKFNEGKKSWHSDFIGNLLLKL